MRLASPSNAAGSRLNPALGPRSRMPCNAAPLLLKNFCYLYFASRDASVIARCSRVSADTPPSRISLQRYSGRGKSCQVEFTSARQPSPRNQFYDYHFCVFILLAGGDSTYHAPWQMDTIGIVDSARARARALGLVHTTDPRSPPSSPLPDVPSSTNNN